jgi:hypothetical protein
LLPRPLAWPLVCNRQPYGLRTSLISCKSLLAFHRLLYEHLCLNVFSSLCAFALAQNVFHLTSLRCDDPSLNPDCYSCESVDRDCGSRWPAQTLRMGLLRLRCGGNDAPASRRWGVRASSGSSANGPALLLAGSRKDGLATASARTEREPHLVSARARVGAGAFPFPSLRTFRATIGADLPASSSSRCFASVRFRFRCLFVDRVAAPAARTAGEALELACF